jgi:hypothetical protein
MMRTLAVVLVLLVGGCAANPSAPDARRSFERASTAAHQSTPRAEPVPLPPLRPASRLQSELQQMAQAEIARWILPPEAANRVVAAHLVSGHMPRVSAISLYEAPRPAGPPGLCAIAGDDVWLRVPDENSLTYQQHLDPPLQPYQRQPFVRWKVVGSTLADLRHGPPDCGSALPYSDWFEAPSAEALFRAVTTVEQAQRGRFHPRLECRQLRYDEALQDFAVPACPNPRALLERFTPDLIVRVRPADCEIAPSPKGCLGVEYHDPAAPRTHSLYVVVLPDEDRPAWIQITQAMLPPS